MPTSLNSKNCQQCEQGQADFLHFSSPRTARFAPQWPRRGNGQVRPLGPSYSQASPPRCPQGGQKEMEGARRPLPPCRAHRSRKAGEWLRTCPGRDPFIRKAAQQAFGLTNGSRTHGKAGEASLVRTRERLARCRNSPYFQREDPATTEPSRMIIPPPSQLPPRSQPAGRERIRTGPYWLCHPVAS